MPFFGNTDFTDPDYQRLSGMLAGLASGFGKAAMPSSLPIGTGAALGMAAEGAYGGAQAGQKAGTDIQNTQMEQATKGIGLDQALMIENLLRSAMGKPPITAKDLQGGMRSPLFGSFTLPGQQTPSAPALNGAGVPAAAPAASAAGTGQVPLDASGGAPAPASPNASPSSAALKSALVNKLLLGKPPTDYQSAKIYADSLPEGADKTEAQQAAAKAAGIDISPDARAGAVHLMWNPNEHRYTIAFRNPQLPEGYTLGEHGEAEKVPGGPEAVSDIESRKAGAHAGGKMKEEAFNNWLETGGNGMGTSTGDVMPGGNGPSPTYAQRVAQIESGGNPAAANGASSATGEHQFLDGTWLDKAKKFLPVQAVQGKTDEQLLALRGDPQASAMVTNGYARENADALQKAGVKNVGATELYLAHHFGPGGAQSILKAPANTPLDQILSPQVLQANPELKGATVADVYSSARHAMNGLQPAPSVEAEKAATEGVKIGGVTSTLPPLSEAAPINRGEIYLKDRIPQWTKQEDAWAESLPSNAIGEQRAVAIADALKATQSGHWAQEKADFAAKLKSVGIDIGGQTWFGDPGKVQEALKNNFQSTLAQIRAFTSRPAAVEVSLASKNFANPDLQPEANLKIISETVGTMRWERALINDWAKAKAQGWQDPQDFQRAWMQHNPLQGYIDASEKQIGPLKGMPGASKPIVIKAEDQAKITPENIAHSAQLAGMTVDAYKEKLRKAGYKVP
jgi:hypothetical protein